MQGLKLVPRSGLTCGLDNQDAGDPCPSPRVDTIIGQGTPQAIYARPIFEAVPRKLDVRLVTVTFRHAVAVVPRVDCVEMELPPLARPG
jgi:hypothetical protein